MQTSSERMQFLVFLWSASLLTLLLCHISLKHKNGPSAYAKEQAANSLTCGRAGNCSCTLDGVGGVSISSTKHDFLSSTNKNKSNRYLMIRYLSNGVCSSPLQQRGNFHLLLWTGEWVWLSKMGDVFQRGGEGGVIFLSGVEVSLSRH